MRANRVLVAVVATVACLVSVAGVAYAAWAKTANGSGTAAIGAITAPASVDSPTQTSSSITVRVVTGPGSGATPSGYRVDETSPAAVSGVCSISGSTGSCNATSLSASTSYTFRAFSLLGSHWISATGTSVTASTTAAASISVSASATKKSNVQNATSDTITVTGSHFAANSSLTASVNAGTITTNISASTNASGTIPAGTTFVMNNPTSAQTVTVTVTDGAGNSATNTFDVTNS